MAVLVNPPCVIHEDEHLLVVNKPSGWNTHAPAPYAGEGVYEWLKTREARWSTLAIIHRLDKETSGLLLFSKTTEANRSLTQQFTEGKVRKEYILLSSNSPTKQRFVIKSSLKRAGDHYLSERGSTSGAGAETEFEVVDKQGTRTVMVARPRTGRTHQIRVHASENGFAIDGDKLYGGAAFHRLCLHAQRIEFAHPASGQTIVFEAPPEFDLPSSMALRRAIIIPSETDSYREVHGASDGFPGLYVDRFGDFALAQSPNPPIEAEWRTIADFKSRRGYYQKITTPHVRGKTADDASPQHVSGDDPQAPFKIRENGVRYEISFAEGYSVGIFLDQRDNRRRLLANYIAPHFQVASCGEAGLPLEGAEILNTFSYTCAFSVCGALAGARVTSLDLSKKYLDWGRRNFQLNNLDPVKHDFIYGDVFDWLKRLAKKNRRFDAVLLDPPTFSKSKESGLFRAEHDYPRLVSDALKVLKPAGVLFASSNAARWAPENFVQTVRNAITRSNRKIVVEHYVPQPPDFPITKAEPAYLKTLWLKIA